MPLGMRMKYHPKPPVPPRAADNEQVAHIDSLVAIGVTQRRIAQHIGVHWRTVANIVNRKGAYAEVPRA